MDRPKGGSGTLPAAAVPTGDLKEWRQDCESERSRGQGREGRGARGWGTTREQKKEASGPSGRRWPMKSSTMGKGRSTTCFVAVVERRLLAGCWAEKLKLRRGKNRATGKKVWWFYGRRRHGAWLVVGCCGRRRCCGGSEGRRWRPASLRLRLVA